MGYARQITHPTMEPISLAQAKNFCKIPDAVTTDDTLVAGLIVGARQYAEALTSRCLAQRQYAMVLDSHPYYADTIQSQLAYPPSWYSLPRYSSTLWNYSQMIKVPFPPLKSVDEMRYVGTDGAAHLMHQDVDFVVDRMAEGGRIFPMPGMYWPSDLYVANSVQIKFTAGYDPDPALPPDVHNVTATPPNQQPDSTVILAVPETIRTALLILISHWYFNREPVAAGSVGSVPHSVNELLNSQAIFDFAPTRG